MGDLSFSYGALDGGGYCTDIDISADGTLRLLRTDVHQCYKFNSSTGLWQGLITPTSMPVGERILGGNGEPYNCYAIRFAPSNPDIIYAVFPATDRVASVTLVYKSTDRGATWAQTSMTPMQMKIAADGRIRGQKMAVHPTDPNICLVGNTAGEIWRTANGGTSWAKITTPTGDDPSIVFDPTDGNKVYIGWSSGTSRIYKSTDAGATFAQMTGGPNTVCRSAAAIDGTIYFTGFGIGSQNAWKLSGTTFTNLSPDFTGAEWHSVACDPTNVNRVTLGAQGGNINTTLDAGATWSGHYGSAAIRAATDVPWLAWTNEDYMSNGNMAYDPVVAGRLWFVQGIGAWYTDSVPTGATQPTWTSKTLGNKELICNDIRLLGDGSWIVGVWDRGIFRYSSFADFLNQPSTHGPARVDQIQHCWSIDYASDDATFIVASVLGTGGDRQSTDSGATWASIPSQVPTGYGGQIAVKTKLNWVKFPSNEGAAYYTTDGGANWELCSFPGDVPTSTPFGWSGVYYFNNKPVCVDKIAGVFYCVNTVTRDLYKSSTGATWTKVADDVMYTYIATLSPNRLLSVPGNTGHMFLNGGTVAAADPHPYNIAGKRSTDHGVTWTNVPNCQEAWCFGFGKTKPGSSAPYTVMAVGYFNGDTLPGVYTSIDDCATWVLQSNYPADSMDLPRSVEGDMNSYGRFAIGMAATGFIYSFPQTVTGKSFGLQF